MWTAKISTKGLGKTDFTVEFLQMRAVLSVILNWKANITTICQLPSRRCNDTSEDGKQGAICYNILRLDSRSEHNWNSYVWLLSRQYIHSTAAQLAQTGWILRPMVPFTVYNRTKRSRRCCYRYTSRFVLSYQDASRRLHGLKWLAPVGQNRTVL